MLFLEPHARWLLLVHAVLGAALVASATHLVIWTRGWMRGHYARPRGVRWFGAIVATLYLLQFGLGNLIYPVYKVRVRAEHFELMSSVVDDARARTEARRVIAERTRAGAVPDEKPADLRPIARLFDVKEHWVALGVPLALAAFLLSRRTPTSPLGGRLLFACAAGAALCAWAGALIGHWVSAVRAVGGIG